MKRMFLFSAVFFFFYTPLPLLAEDVFVSDNPPVEKSDPEAFRLKIESLNQIVIEQARQGDPKALEFIRKSIDSWIKPEAKKGVAFWQHNLALFNYQGLGIPQNYNEAALWLEKAAEQGFVDSQVMLATMHYEGIGLTQNYHEAAKWFEKAAQQDSLNAQFNLGTMYRDGKGVKQNHAEAYFWFNLAASQLKEHNFENASFIFQRDLAARKLNTDVLNEIQKRTSEWKKKNRK